MDVGGDPGGRLNSIVPIFNEEAVEEDDGVEGAPDADKGDVDVGFGTTLLLPPPPPPPPPPLKEGGGRPPSPSDDDEEEPSDVFT